jgi:hypothetical protein
MRMSAYYYSFTPTGVPEIDRILSAVACAGKAYHHTNCWADDSDWTDEGCVGKSPVDWIQNAANDAAAKLSPRAGGASADANSRTDKTEEL